MVRECFLSHVLGCFYLVSGCIDIYDFRYVCEVLFSKVFDGNIGSHGERVVGGVQWGIGLHLIKGLEGRGVPFGPVWKRNGAT